MPSDEELDPRDSRQIVFRYVLESHARELGDRPFVTFPEEDTAWSWAEMDQEANRMANAIASLGVGRGTVVSVLSDNNTALVRTLFGATKIGAIYSPLNTALRASLLAHVLRVAQPELLVVEAQYVARLLDDEVTELPPTILVAGDLPVAERLTDRAHVVALDELLGGADTTPPPDPELEYWDPYAIIFTSGTTGPSKGVLCPYGQLYAQVEHTSVPVTSADDVFLGDLPMFHVGALLGFMTALLHGARWVVLPRVRVEQYLDIIRAHGVTHITMLPAIVNFLDKRPRAPDDADNSIRIVLTGSFFANYDEWCARFGIEHGYGYFNMTEICSPLMTGLDPERRDGTGRVRPGVDVALVDENDRPVPLGTPGELVMRPHRPWEINLGYVGDPAATAAAWRNGWYHTGDLFVADDTGHYSYVDRTKDSIRRRGENISSFEIEDVMSRHPTVLRCAAIAISSDEIAGEDEVMACLELTPDAAFEYSDFIDYLVGRLPHYAVPRYLELFEQLPTSASQKIQKASLRARGVSNSTWDRLAHGITVRRH